MKRTAKPKMFMGVPVHDHYGEHCYMVVKVRVIGRMPQSGSGVSKRYEVEAEQFEFWGSFKFESRELLKFNRRSLRNGSRRWAILRFDKRFVAIAKHLDKFTHAVGECGGLRYFHLSHNDERDTWKTHSPYYAHVDLSGGYFAVDERTTAADIVKRLRQAVDAYEAATAKPPKRSRGKHGLKLIA
jgi:hypothetical protein